MSSNPKRNSQRAPFLEVYCIKEVTLLSHLKKAAQYIYDKQGINILGLNLQGLDTDIPLTLIAEGTSNRHLHGIANFIVDSFQEIGLHPSSVEGKTEGTWIVLDFFFFTIHLFGPDIREKYALEELWRDSKIIDLDIKVHL